METEEIPFSQLLNEIIDNRGKTCPTAERGIPLIATNCIRNEFLYPTYDKVRYVSQETYDTWFRCHPEPGDIIFVNKATPGRVCLVPDPVDFCIAQDMVAIRANPERVYPKYLLAVLRSSSVQEKIEQMHVGTLIPHFKKGDFDKLLLPVPKNRKVQEFIGDIYFIISQKIHLNTKINQTLEEMAQAIFKSWFVDFDSVKAKIAAKAEGRDPLRAAMSAISGKSDTELDQLSPEQYESLSETAALFPDVFVIDEQGNEMPLDWRWGDLGDVIENFDSKRIPLSNREREKRKGAYPYYGAASVMDYVDNFIFDGIYVLMAEDGSVMDADGQPVTQYVWGKFWVNNHAHVLKGKAGVSEENILLFLRQAVIAPYVTGAVQMKLNQKNMNSIPFLKAKDAVHLAFAKIVAPLFEEMRNLTEQIKILSATRDSLLPKLLSGEIKI